MNRISTEITNNESKYAGFGIRIVAFLIDIILLIFFSTLLIVIILKLLDVTTAINPNSYNVIVNLSYIFPAVCFFYFTLLECSSLMTTFGKRWLHLVVVDNNMNKITFIKASVRFFAKSIVFIGFIFILISKKNQALHDIIAKTIVIKK